MRFELRRASLTEAAELTALAHRAKRSWGYPAEWLSEWRPALTITPDYIEQNEVWVAAAEGKLLGMCALEDKQDLWMLEHVWIEPTAQRMGVGSALVSHALERARQRRPVAVELVADPNAAPFYERLGAILVGEEAAPMTGAQSRTLPRYRFGPESQPDRPALG